MVRVDHGYWLQIHWQPYIPQVCMISGHFYQNLMSIKLCKTCPQWRPTEAVTLSTHRQFSEMIVDYVDINPEKQQIYYFYRYRTDLQLAEYPDLLPGLPLNLTVYLIT